MTDVEVCAGYGAAYAPVSRLDRQDPGSDRRNDQEGMTLDEQEQLLAACRNALRGRAWDECIGLCRQALQLGLALEVAQEVRLQIAVALFLKENRTTDDLIEAIEHYEKIFAADFKPLHTSVLHIHLGRAYYELARDTSYRSVSLPKAIAHYEEALDADLPDELLRESIASHVGYALLDLEQGSRISNLERARRHLITALQKFTPLEHPKEARELFEALKSAEQELARLASPSVETESLFQAALSGRVEHMRALLGQGVDLEARDQDGRSALQIALGEGNLDCALLLLAMGASTAAVDASGYTALHWAVFSDRPLLLALSYSAGIGIDPLDNDGRSPLTWAITLEALAAFDWLLSHGADPNLTDQVGWSPLHYAATVNNAVIVRRLLSVGANRLARANDGETPLDVAQRNHEYDVVPLLRGDAN